jgi:hypothetical protein
MYALWKLRQEAATSTVPVRPLWYDQKLLIIMALYTANFHTQEMPYFKGMEWRLSIWYVMPLAVQGLFIYGRLLFLDAPLSSPLDQVCKLVLLNPTIR